MQNNKSKIDTDKFFLANLHHFIAYVFGGQVLPILLIVSVLYLLASINIIFYAIIVMPMIYKFAFDILADTAKGNMSPHVRQNYLVTNSIIIKVVAISILFEFIQLFMKVRGFSQKDVFGFVAVSNYLFPAIYMTLALTNSMLMAFNPKVIYKIINTSFVSYTIFALLWTALIAFDEWLINPLIDKIFPVFVNGVFVSFFKYAILFLAFHIMGYILYQYRNEFDLDYIGAEVENELPLKVKTPSSSHPIHDRIDRLLDDNEIEQALAIIVEQQKEGDNSVVLKDLFKKAMQKKTNNPKITSADYQIHRYLEKGQLNKAFALVISQLKETNAYLTDYPEDINPLLIYAISSNKTQYITPLLKDFDKKYPNHKDLVNNYFLYAKSLYNERKNRVASKKLITSLILKYPDYDSIDELKSWLKGIEMMEGKNDLRR